MRYKLHASIFAMALALVMMAAMSGRTVRATAAPASSALDLLSILPASDVVAFADVHRGLSDVLPRVLVNDAAVLQRINTKIGRFKEETGTDLNLLDTVAVGVSFKDSPSLDPERITVLVRGRFDASEVVSNALSSLKARGKPQPKEESYEGKTVYILEGSPRDPLCMVMLDSNTLAFGNRAGVRGAVDASAGRIERADAEMTGLATSNPNAIGGFAGRVPPAFSKYLSGRDDEFSQAFSNVRMVYGSADVNDTKGQMLVTLRTDNTEQAQVVGRKLSAIKQLASIYLSKSSGKDGRQEAVLRARAENEAGQQVSAGMLPFPPSVLKNAKITTQTNEVQVTLEQTLAEMANIVRTF
jgi:hypothetical protein